MGKQGSKYLFKRSWYTQSVVGSGEIGEYEGAFAFKLNDLPDYTEFTQLFDQYKLCAVKVTFQQPYNDSETARFPRASAAQGTAMPSLHLHHVVDFNDANTLPILNLQQYQNHKVINLSGTSLRGGKTSVYCKPRIALAAYEGAFTGYASQRGWLDVGDAAIQHYGLKWCLDAQYADGLVSISGATWGVTVTVPIQLTYYVAFRNVR